MDLDLLRQVDEKIAGYRLSRGLYSFVSMLIILAELALAFLLLRATVADASSSDDVYYYAGTSAFLLSVDVTLGIRERAASHHVVVEQLEGLSNQIRNPESSLLWQEFNAIFAGSKISYVESFFDLFAMWRDQTRERTLRRAEVA